MKARIELVTHRLLCHSTNHYSARYVRLSQLVISRSGQILNQDLELNLKLNLELDPLLVMVLRDEPETEIRRRPEPGNLSCNGI